MVHSFVDSIPSVFLGAPDEDTVLSVLPGHRLLLSGKGLDAVACAAQGSLAGACVAIVLTFPVFILMSSPIDLYDRFQPLIPGVLVIVMVMLVMAESDDRRISIAIDARARFDTTGWNGSASRCWSPRTGTASEPGAGWNGYPANGSCCTPPRAIGPCWPEPERRPAGRRCAASGRCAGTGGARSSRPWRSCCPPGLIGFVAMNGKLPLTGIWDGIDGNMLFPLLTGLFALPTLLFSVSSGTIPEQEAAVSRDLEARAAIGGALAGGFVGWVPGVTSTTGTMIGSVADPEPGR